MTTQNILIVDDEIDMLHGLQRLFKMETNCEIFLAQSGLAALEVMYRQPVDVVITDIKMPDMDGIDLLEEVMRIHPWITVVMMTAYGTIELAVESIKKGAYDLIKKPFSNEKLLHLTRKSLERSRLLKENVSLQREIHKRKLFGDLVGASLEMRRIYDTMQLVARTDATVLILGESGTGKELAARAIHSLSPRRDKQMVVINCPAIPEDILASELFGYKKGAFTHATQDKIGLFEEAEGSTIFLDEIGDISPSIQAKLLRALQEREIKPLGNTKTKKVNVRILASTNDDLEAKMKKNLFREDLFYRLNVVSITMPPLRKIRGDIPLLANHFVEKWARELSIPPQKLSPEAMAYLVSREWKGNIREMENCIHRAVILCPGDVIQPEDLKAVEALAVNAKYDMQEFNHLPYLVAKRKVVDEFARGYVADLLRRTKGSVTLAAEESGLERQSLQKIMRRYRIKSKLFREEIS